jgi:apolipoprotein N-acyltransferase
MMPAFLALTLSAALLCLTLAWPATWGLGWFALWPVFWLLDKDPSWKTRLLLGACWLFLISQMGFPYAVSTAYLHLDRQNPLGAWLMGTTLGVITSLRYLVFMFLASPRANRTLGWAALWCACELLIWQMMPVYGGVHVLGDLAFIQWAEIVGAPGLSWLWFVLSFTLYQGVRERPRLIPGLALFVAVHGVGLFWLYSWERRMLDWPRRRVAVIQANQPASLVRTMEVGLAARQRMLEQTQKWLETQDPKPEVVIWPEASLPLIEYQRLGGLSVGTQLIFADHEPGSQQGYVVARLLDKEGRSLASYRKRKLILMGEWRPWAPEQSLQTGDRDQLLPSALGPALPLVCFEGLWPSFVASFQRHTGAAATWVVHLGSESSFGSPLACRQSLHLALLRAVELRRPMVRADNSGVSGWIDPSGHLYQATIPFTSRSQTMVLAIDPHPAPTLYTRWGDLPLAVLIAGGLWALFKPLRKVPPCE